MVSCPSTFHLSNLSADVTPPEANKTPPDQRGIWSGFGFGPKLDPTTDAVLYGKAAKCLSYLQARQESNLQPRVMRSVG